MVGLDRQRVRLESYRVEWREWYRSERRRLSHCVGDEVRRFEHVGSTAIEGMPAKPVVDILATVEDIDDAASVAESIEEMGYECRSDGDDHLFFAKGPEDNRTHYVHLAEAGSEYATEMLAFRDYLRDHPDTAAAYAKRKRSLAERFPEDRDAYTEGKSAFVEGVLEDALGNR